MINNLNDKVFESYEFDLNPGSMIFVKNGFIYAVKIEASQIRFNGSIKDWKLTDKDWIAFDITCFIAHKFIVSYDSELESLIKKISPYILTYLIYSEDDLLISKYNTIKENIDIEKLSISMNNTSNLTCWIYFWFNINFLLHIKQFNV